MVLTLSEGIGLAEAQVFYRDSFFCGTSGNAACLPCHPSCSSCTEGICDSCKDSNAVGAAEGSFCHCDGNWGWDTSAYHESCSSCNKGCQTCEKGEDSQSCYTCKEVGISPKGSPAVAGSCGCGEGFMASPSNPSECLPCHASCKTCVDGTSGGCQSCMFANTVLSNPSGGTCSCNPGYAVQSSATQDCVPCDPSCSSCNDGSASGCLTCKIATAVVTDVSGGWCYCPEGFMTQESPVTECVPCHSSCKRCINGLIGGCLSCKVMGARLTNPLGGLCTCGDGYAPQEGVSDSCVPCDGCRFCSGPRTPRCMASKDVASLLQWTSNSNSWRAEIWCRFCSGSGTPQCMASRDMAVFGTLADSNYVLPMSKVNNGAVCYGSKIPSSPKDLSVFEGILGTLTSDGPVAIDKCYELLQMQWPSLIYWFNMLLPKFTPPSEATEFQIYSIKTVVWLWVLRFGPAVLAFDNSWRQLISALNAPQSEWYKYLAWKGTTPGYSIDGKTVRNFPVALEGAITSGELAVLNLFSKVCQTFGCALKVQCQQVTVSSPCTAVV